MNANLTLDWYGYVLLHSTFSTLLPTFVLLHRKINRTVYITVCFSMAFCWIACSLVSAYWTNISKALWTEPNPNLCICNQERWPLDHTGRIWISNTFSNINKCSHLWNVAHITKCLNTMYVTELRARRLGFNSRRKRRFFRSPLRSDLPLSYLACHPLSDVYMHGNHCPGGKSVRAWSYTCTLFKSSQGTYLNTEQLYFFGTTVWGLHPGITAYSKLLRTNATAN
jgi:hypothetical protein